MKPTANVDKFAPKAYFHVYNHAVGNDNLFRLRDNYFYFLAKFKEYIAPVCKCYAYCLMPNHFHFLLQVKSQNELFNFQEQYKPKNLGDSIDWHKVLMNQLSRMLNGYAQAYNKMFERKGALFLDYTRRKEVELLKYLNNLIYYIHHNPVHHGLRNDVRDWEFSSYNSMCSEKPTILEREATVGVYGSKNDFEHFHLSNQARTGFINQFEF